MGTLKYAATDLVSTTLLLSVCSFITFKNSL
jgi:hypothetical protein